MKVIKRWLILCIWLLVLALTACTTATTTTFQTVSAESPEPVLQPVETDTPATSEAAAETMETPDADTGKTEVEMGDAVLVYLREGGLQGIGPGTHQWHFYADGRIVGNDGREWQVAPEEIEKLVDDVMALGFADFEASYIPEDTCCDRVTHTLAVQQDGQVHKVSVLDAADAPAELFQAVNMVNDYLMSLPAE